LHFLVRVRIFSGFYFATNKMQPAAMEVSPTVCIGPSSPLSHL
jgi:hypothetical protein